MTENQELSHLTSAILIKLTEVFKQSKPQLILVHGDTTTTFAASLSAYYHRIPIAHIEAGLRTNDLMAPWPEEANRKLTDALSSFYFAPTFQAKQNLLREGVGEEKIYVTGNTVIDSLYEVCDQLESDPLLRLQMKQYFPFLNADRKMILVTSHRRENFGEGFQRICRALVNIASLFPNVDIVYPVHLNPNVQEPVKESLSKVPNIYLIAPLDYLHFIYLMKTAHIILTDSGGVQEEAPSLGKPVLVMRDKTERPEAVEAGTVKLVGSDVNKIVDNVKQLLMNDKMYQSMSCAINPYGDGKAATRILRVVENIVRATSNLYENIDT